jgi:hypothetical protein
MPRSFFLRGRLLAMALLAACTFLYSGCGSSSPTPQAGLLDGNWQFTLVKNYPEQKDQQLFASGFLQEEAGGNLTGSVAGPVTATSTGSVTCGGTGDLIGSVSSQNVSFTLNPGGTTFNFTGAFAAAGSVCSGSPLESMSGSYQGLAGSCYNAPTSGTWYACQLPALSGSFTGTLQSTYMQALSGSANPVPVAVSGTFTQTSNAGGSSATLTGTITAANYPCFTSASLTGTISGQNIYLSVFSYNGTQIGTIGQIEANGVAATPAILSVGATGSVVSGTAPGGFNLDLSNPCPAIINSFGVSQTTDTGDFTLNMQ